VTNEGKRDPSDGMDVSTVKEIQIEGRHSDQSNRHHAEHDSIGCAPIVNKGLEPTEAA
jgi:hypothetical protein